jgi:HPt (histidine-containing phosphotransfer) domain-containing protein
MTNSEETVDIDLSNLYAIAGGDDSFVSILLMKMCSALPVAYTNMENAVAGQDWPALKSAAHKAKSTFAYLGLDDMKNRLKDIEHNAMEGEGLDDLPQMTTDAIVLGKKILKGLEAKLAELS